MTDHGREERQSEEHSDSKADAISAFIIIMILVALTYVWVSNQ